MKLNSSLKRIRLGNYIIGGRIQTSKHKLSGQFMFGHVADTIGIMNSFKNTTQQVLFIDYDLATLSMIENEIREIQIHNELGDAFIFESSPGHYFVIFLDLIEPYLVRYILNHSEFIDSKFVFVYNKYGDNTLRILPKVTEKSLERPIKFRKIIEGNNINHIKHKGLWLSLVQIYPIGLSGYYDSRNIWDNSTPEDCKFKSYETVNW